MDEHPDTQAPQPRPIEENAAGQSLNDEMIEDADHADHDDPTIGEEDADSLVDPETELLDEAFEGTSNEYLGHWNRLISTTNWEKGRIISQWREALIEAGASPQAYSDEAWSRRVGAVSGQHVGRLRRVWTRFGDARDQYDGLYWSHFQAAIDWLDAEMYLEGAVQNGWSITKMRRQRWEAEGALADQKPQEEDVVAAERDEDVEPAFDDTPPESIEAESGVVQNPQPGDPLDGDPNAAASSQMNSRPEGVVGAEPDRPFEDLGQLPDDLQEAFEAFQIAILNHKAAGWSDISRHDVLTALDGLKRLALAPSEDAP